MAGVPPFHWSGHAWVARRGAARGGARRGMRRSHRRSGLFAGHGRSGTSRRVGYRRLEGCSRRRPRRRSVRRRIARRRSVRRRSVRRRSVRRRIAPRWRRHLRHLRFELRPVLHRRLGLRLRGGDLRRRLRQLLVFERVHLWRASRRHQSRLGRSIRSRRFGDSARIGCALGGTLSMRNPAPPFRRRDLLPKWAMHDGPWSVPGVFERGPVRARRGRERCKLLVRYRRRRRLEPMVSRHRRLRGARRRLGVLRRPCRDPRLLHPLNGSRLSASRCEPSLSLCLCRRRTGPSARRCVTSSGTAPAPCRRSAAAARRA